MKGCCKCGKNLEDNMKFCFICGAEQISDKVEAMSQVVPPASKEAKLKVPSKVVYFGHKISKFFKSILNRIKRANPKVVAAFTGCAVFVLIMLILFLRVFIGSGAMSPKSAVKKYLKSIDKESEKSLVSATMSNRMYRVMDCTHSDLIETIDEDLFNLTHEDVDYKDIKVKSIHQLNTSKVKDFNEEYKDEYDKNPHFSRMAEITGTYRVREAGDSWDKEEFTFIAYKQAGNWYILDRDVFKYADGESLKIDKDMDSLYSLKETVDELLQKEEFKNTVIENTEIYENGYVSLEKVGNSEAFVDAVREAFDNDKKINLESKLGKKKSKTSIKISTKNGACIIRVKSALDDNEYTFTIDKVRQSE